MTIAKRLTAAGLLLAVVLAGLLVLRPAQTTYAAWSDEVTVPVPTLQTGGVRLEVVPAGGTAATVAMAGDTAGTWRPTQVRVSVDGRDLTGTELAGSRIEYRLAGTDSSCPTGAATYTATPSGSATSFAVTGGDRLDGARTLCLTLVPSDTVRIQYGERTLSLTTSIDGVSTPATWTAAGTWAAEQQLPAGPSVSGPTCSRGFLNQRVTLDWSWDRAGLSQNVSHWALQVEDRGTWHEVRSLGANRREAVITPYDAGFIAFSTFHLRVVAVLPDGTTIPSTDTTKVRVERLGLGAAYCA